MRATLLNCSLKPSPEPSNTQVLADVVVSAMKGWGVETTSYRLADLDLAHGVETDMGDGDDWPRVHESITSSEILVFATPTWVGHPSSYAQQAIERLDAMISETDDDGKPVAYDRVAGVVVTGNEDGAHHVISEIAGALGDIGFTVPGQAWTYWNRGPGPGPSFTETDEGHDWSRTTGVTMAANLVAVARALGQSPMSAPPSDG
ncbi:flavodoxin family protein [Mumia sp. Pv 4-285]|uniref:flavodoxin family protein n=1 Tax=Mumia qirimensis TaxID=3234852 RepID=UPI00351D4018